MGQIKVVITDHTGAKQTPVELPDDVPARKLIPQLVARLGLPAPKIYYPEFAGEKLRSPTYVLDSGKFRLAEDDARTLEQVGAITGDEMRLLPNIVGLETTIERLMFFVSGKTFYETAIAVAFQSGKDITALVIPKSLLLKELVDFLSVELGFHPMRRNHPTLEGRYLYGPYSLFNATTSTKIDQSSDQTVGDVMYSGDWIIAYPSEKRVESNSREQEDLVKITFADIKGADYGR